jgi:hypothetical protein
MNKYKNQSFFKLALRFAIIFLIFVSIIEMVFSIIKNGSFSAMTQQYFSAETWQYYLKRIVVMSTIYGVFMAGYYKFIKK